ncbi:type 2 lanthipeptide synthetase LanM family protein [Clavibacter michiganensis]|uniref:type 2 lanthipeptide synthetase LanM family protein n=1 Tax=Clavibacter michiganensis TaxID=28447 RepID=UPI001366089B|nr:type 2 lanthipeptide synthetase LanM family protein [Clavibacter michiganensis]MDO4041886.1 type 2 lanthipeptide synthetase LanM family protein [Clavibacter michiganensis]MDO4058646.1 type 2 lanthipeptide synthetase LanM family protein [Clavibacter michiganensis]MDO4078719.1 type 2 lanthipeptide synthetase LanM family protein [Clavibacter michiganensis]MDO4094256.1 type 2 lanthipeptide synthetase LanM family protein [Clavibacter michiganensis]MDO4102087.1 type 2 lanthipeptide synthetase Lan
MTITAAELSLLQASRLRERRAATRADARPVPELTRAWRDDALVDDGTHAAYLAGQLLDGDDLVALLAGDAWTPRAASADWLARVDPWLVHPPVSAEAYAPANGHLVVEDTRVAGLPFAALLGPMVGAQRAHLDGRPWLSRTARADLLDGLAERLATLSLRALLAELARDPAPGRHARLDARLADPAHRAELLSRHPVLARDLVTAIGSWRAHVARILDRLHADHGDLVRMGLATERLDALEAVDLSSGDPHDGGQSVATLRFSDGSRLVYKPRDCRVFALYRDLVDALAPALPGEIRLRAAAVLPRDGYGWVEFVAHAEDAASAIPLSRHLGRLGSLLAVAHVLGASDLHLENVIASADGPVPIDLETLIQNRSEVDGEDGTALRRASRMLNASVLGSGILPVQLTTGEGTSIDVSVSTGGLHGAGTTATVHHVVDAATDRMRIEAREMPVGRSRNQPPGATLARIRSGRAALADGYERTFRAIVERRAEVRAILSAAPDISSRHIVRATRSYSLLLTEMRRPRPLRSGIDRDHLLRHLWTRVEEHPADAALVEAEERALWRLDVPLFSTRMDARALIADDEEAGPQRFARSTREDVLDRLARLTLDDLPESLRLVDESVLAATATPDGDDDARDDARGRQAADATAWSARAPRVDDDALREAARGQARILLDSAILGRDDATWIGVSSSLDSSGLEYRPAGPTLYDGLAGIAFAATHAHGVLPGLGLDDLAGRAMHAVTAILDDWTRGLIDLPVGAYSGATGLLHALAHHDARVGGDGHRDLRAAAVRRLGEVAHEDAHLDVMAGVAGACAVVAGLPEGATEAGGHALRALAGRLMSTAVEVEGGALVWETGAERARLGGFSHGASGVGWALARTAGVLGDDAIADAAVRALRFDDALFDPSRRRWRDARPEARSAAGSFPAHWCHGTAGIAMARADAAATLDRPDLLELALVGARETASDALPSDDSLCHGTLGNLIAVRGATRRTGVDTGLAEYRDRALQRVLRAGPRSGLPEGVTSVRGLMLGTSGALYALCRELEPGIPDALLLEGPR